MLTQRLLRLPCLHPSQIPGEIQPTPCEDDPISSSTDSLPRPRPVVVPVRSAFPLDILRHISRFLDRPTSVSLINASFACLDVCAPVMLEQVVIAEDRFDRPGGQLEDALKSLFAERVSGRTPSLQGLEPLF